jgi:galactose mutarotase-like enzyme
MPDADRSDWVLELPEREAVELDRSMLPTVGRRAEPAEAAVLGDRTFDHAYALGGDRVLGLSVGDHTTRVVFGHGYPFAQVYVPGSFDAVALEPMTAPIDALRTGEHPQVTPGGAFSATFRVELS